MCGHHGFWFFGFWFLEVDKLWDETDKRGQPPAPVKTQALKLSSNGVLTIILVKT